MKKVKVNSIPSYGIIINVDSKIEYNQNKIPNSKNIPYDTLVNHYRELLNKNDVYYFYCKSGIKSKRIVTILEYLGYNVVMIEK